MSNASFFNLELVFPILHRWQVCQEISIKLALLPAQEMLHATSSLTPQRSLRRRRERPRRSRRRRRCSLKMKAPSSFSFDSFQPAAAKQLPYMLLFHSGDRVRGAFGLELLEERKPLRRPPRATCTSVKQATASTKHYELRQATAHIVAFAYSLQQQGSKEPNTILYSL